MSELRTKVCAELMEIDENLARSELTPAEEAACIARRKEIWDEMNNGASGGQNLATRSTGKLATTGPQHQKQFAAEIASITGDSKSGINPTNAKLRSSSPVNPLILNDTEL